jgi:uncharacterized membrane protein YjjP (DUF1212 family)
MKGMELLSSIKLAAVALAFVMFAGSAFYLLRGKTGAAWMQAFGLTLLVPTILVLAVTESLSKDMLAVLLGGVAGYIFGVSRSD